MKAPIIVLRRWPAWKGFAILGDENSTITSLPFPSSLVPYFDGFETMGPKDDESLAGLSASIVCSVMLFRVLVTTVYCRIAPLASTLAR